ncbi:MAG: hypothetical protein ACRDGS_04075 [Chloroflexota bacterium]
MRDDRGIEQRLRRALAKADAVLHGFSEVPEHPGDPCDQPLTRPFALVLSALAPRAVAMFLHDGIRENFEITWADLRISRERA